MRLSFLLIFIFFNHQLFSQELKIFSAVGGKSSDDFFQEGITDVKDAFTSFGVKENSQNYYFGGSDREGICLSTMASSDRGISLDDYRQKVAKAKTCEDFDYNFGLRFILGEGAPKKKECFEKGTVSLKEANAKNILDDIKNQNLQSGSTVYIHLSDHGGNKSYGQGDWIITMSNRDNLKAKEVADTALKLAQKNIKVQLSFDACYSGGFTDEIYKLKVKNKLGRNLCSSSSTESNYSGYGSDPLLKAGFSENYFKALKKYGNQLSAVACASGSDSLNVPVTTLLRFSQNLLASNLSNCESCEKSFSTPLSSLAFKMKKEALLNDYKRYYSDVALECYNARATEQKIISMFEQCLPEDHPYSYLLKPFFQRALGAKALVKKSQDEQFEAIRSITDEKTLSNYLDEFCCLATPLDKTKEGPASCAL